MSDRTTDREDDLSAAPVADTVDKLLAEAVAAPPVFPALADGTVVRERYEIERVLGAGGMGTVYLARDRQLDRPVALKLHRTPVGPERLHREALAMAKLAHPNVVTVFEIGEYDGRPFVAMEYVQGASLREWLEDSERSQHEILRALLAAGEGLAAVHDANLVHRDVKPDNIFVGLDGRVRIGDFGLAQLGRQQVGALRVPLGKSTATGMIVGTPAYMAPEQIEGGELDARTDQFAFCVAAWEALCGNRPFGGADTDELDAAIRRGEPAKPRRRVSPLIRRVLARGMAAQPVARWPSMRKLLAALRSAELRPRLRAVAIGATLALGAAVAWTLWPTPNPTEECFDSGADIVTLLPAATIDAAAARAKPQEAPILRKLVAQYTTGYRELARVTCEARMRNQWTPNMYAASRECASLRIRTLRELLALVPASAPGNALPIVSRAPSLLACADPKRVAAWRWLVPGTTATDAVVTARARLDAASVLADLDQLADARRVRDDAALGVLAKTNHDVARRLDLLRAQLAIREDKLGDAEPLLTGVYYDARSEHDADSVLAAVTQLIDLAARVRRDHAAAVHWIREGLVEADELQLESPQRTFELVVTAAMATEELGDHKRVLELCDLAEKLGTPPTDERRFEVMPIRANALAETGKLDDAIELSEQYVDKIADILGPNHPRVADALAQYAALLAEANKDVPAAAAALRATQILEDSKSDDSSSVATASLDLGVTLLKLDDPAARPLLERARAIWVAAHGEDHPDVALVDINLALFYMDKGDSKHALAMLRQATAIQERTLGPEHHELAAGLYNLAVAERQAGELDAALATSRRCAAILARHEAGSQRHLEAVIHTAMVLNLLKRYDEALETATDAVKLRDDDPQSGAWARLEAGRALVGLHRDRDKARALLADARTRYEMLNMTPHVVEIDKLLAGLR